MRKICLGVILSLATIQIGNCLEQEPSHLLTNTTRVYGSVTKFDGMFVEIDLNLTHGIWTGDTLVAYRGKTDGQPLCKVEVTLVDTHQAVGRYKSDVHRPKIGDTVVFERSINSQSEEISKLPGKQAFIEWLMMDSRVVA
jgi:hypothetical protein